MVQYSMFSPPKYTRTISATMAIMIIEVPLYEALPPIHIRLISNRFAP